jgi:hypothetical protein
MSWHVIALLPSLAGCGLAAALSALATAPPKVSWEPWKAMSIAFGAGVAVATGLIALGVWLGLHLNAVDVR